MSIMDLNKIAETVTQPVFRLDEALFLPHYRDAHMWVGPGNNLDKHVLHTDELVRLGARLSVMSLWRRSWTDMVQGWRDL